MNYLRHHHYRQRAILGTLSLAGFAFLYLAAKLFGNEGIEYLFAGVDREAIHMAGHIVVYGTLAVMLAKALGNRYLAAWVIGNILAAGEEWHQLIVPGRVASFEDALLNLIAITAFLAMANGFDAILRSSSNGAATEPATSKPVLVAASTSQNGLSRATMPNHGIIVSHVTGPVE